MTLTVCTRPSTGLTIASDSASISRRGSRKTYSSRTAMAMSGHAQCRPHTRLPIVAATTANNTSGLALRLMVMSRMTSTLVPKTRARVGVTLPARARSIHCSDNTQSVLAAVDDLIGLDPGHHVTLFLTDQLDLMMASEAAQGLLFVGVCLVFV